MFEPRLGAALAAGSTVVTPNKRLARALVAAHDRAQRSSGHRSWHAARALPWSAWLEQLWADAVAHDAMPAIARLLRASQSRRCWQQIVAATDAPIANVAGAADLGLEAWALMKAWGAGAESWRAWRGDALADDSAIFAGWAEQFHSMLRDLHGTDAATLADVLAAAAPSVRAWRDLDIVIAGFLETTPQQERLIAALAQGGARITRLPTLADSERSCALASARSPGDEMLTALTWARKEAIASPDTTIGIAVLDLAARREEVIALADDVLCPATALRGADGAPRPYNVSLGANLASAPLVAAALDWIEIAGRPLSLARAAALLRSPYLPDAESQWPRRAATELAWLNDGRREIALTDAIAALERVDERSALRLKRAFAANRLPRDASPKAWVDAWRRWLAAIGWPGDRTLDSAEQQTRQAFDELLADFAAMTIVETRLRIGEASEMLRDLATQAIFQPESPPVPIQMAGLLEATGLPFDRLWIAGMAAHRWPRPPQPHPLLPLAWQRERDVSRSSAARELRFAQMTTATLLRGAPQVVVSYAQGADDEELPRPSALVLSHDPAPFAARSSDVREATAARRIHAARPQVQTILDHRAPPLAESAARGGARVFEAQANCAFQAIGLHRLRAKPWPALPAGLTAIERGTLVHAALASFWADVRDHATLSSLDPPALAARIADATAAARGAIRTERWRSVPAVIAAGETARLHALLCAWIDTHERPRPPFVVEGVERDVVLTLAGIAFRLRIDRLDRIGDGVAIIDYKTGITPAPRAWFDERPRSPQIGLYTLARRQAAPDSVTHAAAYAQLRSGELRINGVVDDAALWPALTPVGQMPAGSWPAFEAWWNEHLASLADELRGGVATVAPRDGAKTCRNCGLFALCRIRSATAVVEELDDD